MDFIEISAKTVEEAIAQGVAQLSRESKEVVETKVLQEPSSGFLGIGRKPAVIRLFFEETKSATSVKEDMPVSEVSVQEEVTVAKEIVSEPVVAESVVEVVEVAAEEDATVLPAVKASAEEQAVIAAKGKQFLQDMFAKMGLKVAIEKMTTPDKITFQVHGEDLGILIGKRGQTLDAIQYLTNLVANKEVRNRCHVVVDVENYRSRREETLVQLAKRLGSKVKRNRQKIALEPMNAYERKIIHLTLQDEPHIVTDSEGEEPYRHVVIAYKR